MVERDSADVATVVSVLQRLWAGTPHDAVLVSAVLAQTTLRMPRVVALVRRYGAEIAARLGVAQVRYEPGRYVRYVGPTPARIYVAPTATVQRSLYNA